jgi:glycosyltransferase involved in cell wall biosynthesis
MRAMRPRPAASNVVDTDADPRTPNLFVLGAPKAGTTFLHEALRLAPNLYMSPVKEPSYFMSPRELRRGLSYYLDAYFARAAGFPIRGESTPWYLYSDLAREGIGSLTGVMPRFIVMVRRPSDRAQSMYLDQVRLNREPRNFEDAVHAEIEGFAAGELVEDIRRRYVWGGLYCDHIERWQRAFGESRVHVVVFDDLIHDAERVWTDLGEFLGRDLGAQRFDAVSERDRNPSGTLRWPRVDAFLRSFEGRDSRAIETLKGVLPPGLHRRVLQQVSRLNRTLGTPPALQPDQRTLEALDDFYRPEVERLGTLLGRPLTNWCAPRDGSAERSGRQPSAVAPTSMRILHLVSHSHRRGAELAAAELADELERRGHRNRVLALAPALDGGRAPGVTPLARFPGTGVPELLVLAWKLRREFSEEPVDVILAHGGWPAQVAALATPRGGPLIVWQRILGFPDKVWGPARRRWWAIMMRRIDAGVALTEALEGELRHLGFAGPVWIIPNSRKPDRFLAVDRSAARARLCAEIDVPDGTPIIGFIGHLVRQKRPERVIEVLALLRARGSPAHLVVAGAGPLRPDVEAQARRLGVADAVVFLGHRDDVEWVFGGVDLVVLTSEAEGIPGVAIEAAMAGCPMVTVPVGGVAEVVEHGVTGVVLEGDGPEEMAGAVAALLADDAARARMSRHGRERAPGFSASATAAVYADRLTDALAKR